MDPTPFFRDRAETPNIKTPELPEWVRGKRRIRLARAKARAWAQNPIDRLDAHRHLRKAQIVLLARTGGQAGADGTVSLAKAARTSPVVTYLSAGADFVLTLNGDQWPQMPKAARLALLDHELSHCGVTISYKHVPEATLAAFVERLGELHVETRTDDRDSDGAPLVRWIKTADGKPVWRIRRHDVECFAGVVRRWGLWLPSLGALAAAMDEHATAGGGLFAEPADESAGEARRGLGEGGDESVPQMTQIAAE